MRKVILVFIDGLGIGLPDPQRNPVLPVLSGISPDLRLCGDSFPAVLPSGTALALDACLGVPGIPQSATGQTSLYTGVNAQARLGYHLTAMPNEPLIELINRRSLPAVLKQAGIRPVNANLHSPGYFRMRRGGHRNRFPVSTVMTFAARIPFLFDRDYREGWGIFMDITNAFLRGRGMDIPLITPEDAAERLIRMTGPWDFVYYEYFLTDKWGHKRNWEAMEQSLRDLIPFLGALSREAPRQGIDVIIVSDHGNAEDMTTGNHTRNPVPFVHLSPPGEEKSNENMPSRLTGVYPMILNLYNLKAEPEEGVHRG